MRNELQWFSREEFRCSCCGKEEMNDQFLTKIDDLRELCGFPFVVTSGYRCANHQLEKVKVSPGWHNKGRAVDIAIDNSMNRFILIQNVMKMGCFHGIGIGPDFVHVDDRHQLNVPAIWVYE